MFVRTTLVVAAAGALLATVPGSASAVPKTESIDRRVFDATPQLTASSLRVDGPTAGPLGGAMDVTVQATDGTLPTVFGSCEAADVTAVVTVQPGQVMTVSSRGEVCAHIVDGSLTFNAGFRAKDVSYEGYGRPYPKLVGDGLIAVSHSWFGGQASFFGAFH
jgi:hypothetical protein